MRPLRNYAMGILYCGLLATMMICCSHEDQPLTDPQVEVSSIDTTISLDFLMGKFIPESDSLFVMIPQGYANRTGHYLQKETWESFKKMHKEALKDSIYLKIISSTRNFDIQRSIWEAKWTGARKVENGMDLSKDVSDPLERASIILRYSSMPGTSRHHWGTDLDINALTNSYFESGKGLKEYNWLVAHASKFGFCQPYTSKDESRPNGYNEEKWHWSYIPIASKYTQQIPLRLKNEDINGFLGSGVAPQLDVVSNYILGINKDCL